MAFICKDCGNKSTRKFPGGKCPACDSFNIRNTGSTKEAIREKEPKTLVEIVVMILVWVLLAYGVWDRYIRVEPDASAEPVVAPAAQQPAEEGY